MADAEASTLDPMMLILVVDDEPATCEALRRVLERMGHAVMTAHSDKEAVEIVKAHRVHVALLDWQLGTSLTGADLGSVIQRMRPECATILVSGFTKQDMRAAWSEALRKAGFTEDPLQGVRAFVPKGPNMVKSLEKWIRAIADSIEDTKP